MYFFSPKFPIALSPDRRMNYHQYAANGDTGAMARVRLNYKTPLMSNTKLSRGPLPYYS